MKKLFILELKENNKIIKLKLSTDNNTVKFKSMNDVNHHICLAVDEVYGEFSNDGLKNVFQEIVKTKLILEKEKSLKNECYLSELRDILDDYHMEM